MGQDQSKGMRCGAYQQDTTKQVKGSDAALRIRRQLEEGKVKPQQTNLPIQNYQPPPPPSPPRQINAYQKPVQQNIIPQPAGKNIQIRPHRDMIRQQNQRRASLNKIKPPDGRPPKPKSAKPVVTPIPKPEYIQLEHQNIIRFSQQPFFNCVRSERGFIQNVQMSLAQLIQSRYNTKMYFPQQNVISLLQSIIYAMAALEVKKIRHHDIYPTNIYFHNGIFKLSNPFLNQLSSYSLTLQRKRFSFLSPELIIYLRQEVQDVKEDLLFRADIFSFGMIMLQFCSLKPSNQCYDQENYDIIDVVIKRRLAEIQQIYNPKIAEAIDLFLRYEINQRISAFEFSKHLNQYMHQYQLDMANSKKSQLTIHPETQSTSQTPRQQPPPPITPANLPQGIMPSQTSQVNIHQQKVQGQPQMRPVVSAPSSAPQYHLQKSSSQQQLQQQIQSQSNSQLKILQPINKPISEPIHLQQQQQQQLPPYQMLVQSNPSPSGPPPTILQNQHLPSYPYIQSNMNPLGEQISYQVQRQYNTPPASQVETKPYQPPSINLMNQYASTTNNNFNPNSTTTTYSNSTYSQQYSLPHVSSAGVLKTLGQFEYNNIPSYRDDYMKAERDVGYKQVGGGYKQYRDVFKESGRDLGGYRSLSKDKQWSEVKNELSSKYTYGGSSSTGSNYPLSSRAEEQSLQERVRRILEKSKQIK